VPSALFLALAAGATARGLKLSFPDRKLGALTFSSKMGQVIPTHAGKSLVTVLCDGSSYKSHCRGSLQIVPRGATRAALGPAPIAAVSLGLQDNANGDHILDLSTAAKQLLANHYLSVTLRLTQPGRSLKARPALLALERRTLASRNPSRVQHFRSPAGSTTTSTYTWDWTIKAGSFKVLPDWRCPGGEPNIARGRTLNDGWAGWEAKLEVEASSGTGYAAFDQAHTSSFRAAVAGPWYKMHGWPEGGWFHNSAWAPWTTSGHFKLKVTCTSFDQSTPFGRAGLYQAQVYSTWQLFPWKNN
jgi:hypothetical protein